MSNTDHPTKAEHGYGKRHGHSRLALAVACVSGTILLFMFAAGKLHGSGGHDAGHEHLPALWGLGILPFVLLLGAIAILPLVPRMAMWWHQNLNKLAVGLFLAALTAGYLYATSGVDAASTAIDHGVVREFVPFILLLFSLYVIAGGILVSGDLPAHPWTNTAILGVGAIIASVVGTTGASMLLIRPLLQTNSERRKVAHTVIFFIFIVSNAGGCLLPVGDPPLFLGYLHGVPFLWTTSLWPEWAMVCASLLAIHHVLDEWMWRKERPADLQRDESVRIPMRVEGNINLLWLALAVVSVAVVDPHRNFPGMDWHPWQFLREGLLVLFSGLSLATTPRGLRARNRFSYGAILEVAALFGGIFVTMQVPLMVLLNKGGELGIHSPTQFFWITGLLSSVLDNAPTYEVFFRTASTISDPAVVGAVQIDRGVIDPILLRAVSLGAVFMGANTYIGNGPNFMVKSIAEQAGVRMPSFFGYMLWSGAVLIPLFILTTILFMR